MGKTLNGLHFFFSFSIPPLCLSVCLYVCSIFFLIQSLTAETASSRSPLFVNFPVKHLAQLALHLADGAEGALQNLHIQSPILLIVVAVAAVAVALLSL